MAAKCAQSARPAPSAANEAKAKDGVNVASVVNAARVVVNAASVVSDAKTIKRRPS